MHRILCFLLRDELARSIPRQATFRSSSTTKTYALRTKTRSIERLVHRPNDRAPSDDTETRFSGSLSLSNRGPARDTDKSDRQSREKSLRRGLSSFNVESENISLAISKSWRANFAYITSTLATSRVASFSRSNRRISILDTFESKVWRLKMSSDRKSKERFANRMQDIYNYEKRALRFIFT